MGRAPCCDKANVKKGPWSPEEDAKLKEYIEKQGTGGNWIALPQKAGLKRCGKSCRLRWLNYLRPNIKHGDFTEDEDRVICSLFASIGSRWSVIAAHLPGRTDNDIKNYWNTKLKKKLMAAAPPPLPPVSLPPPHHHHHHQSLHLRNTHQQGTAATISSSSSSSSPLSSSSSSISFNSSGNATTYYSPTRSFNGFEPINSNISSYPSSVFSNQMSHGRDDQEMGCLVNFIYNSGVHEENQSNVLLPSWGGGGGGGVGATTTTSNMTSSSIDQTQIMDYGLEEIKQLISSSTSCGNNTSNLLFDENKTEEKFMLYY